MDFIEIERKIEYIKEAINIGPNDLYKEMLEKYTFSEKWENILSIKTIREPTNDKEEIYIYQGGVYVRGESILKEDIEKAYRASLSFAKSNIEDLEQVQLVDNLQKEFEFLKAKFERMNHTGLSTSIVNEVLNIIRRNTCINRSDLFTPGYKIVVRNGILDLETLTLEPHSPKFVSIFKIPVKYDPNVKPGKIVEIIKQILKPEDIQVFQEWLGYNLWVFDYSTQKALMLVGEGGNGKSTLLNLIIALLGRENVSAKSLHELESDPYAKAYLFGKIANIYPDLPETDLKSTGTFKMLTGGDIIESRKLYEGPFSFYNIAKLSFSCNKVPYVRYDDSDAFFRRWIIVETPYKFEGTGREVKGIANELIKNEKEMSGFLNWALEGLQRLKNQSWHFSYGKSWEETRDEYIIRSNPYKAFKTYCTLLDPNSETKKDEIFEAYVEFCNLHKLVAVSYDTFYKNFKFEFAPGEIMEIRLKMDELGNRPRAIKGIKLRPKSLWNKLPSDDELEGEKENIEYYKSEEYFTKEFFSDLHVELINHLEDGATHYYVIKIPEDPPLEFSNFLNKASKIKMEEFEKILRSDKNE